MGTGSAYANEGQLQKAAIKALELAGAFVENRSPSYWGEKGVPDLTGILLGRPFAIELKNPKMYGPPKENDKRWPLQKAYLRRVEKAGGYALGTNLISAIHDLISFIESRHIFGFYREEWLRKTGRVSVRSNEPCVP